MHAPLHETKSTRFDSLDGLRAVACFLVIWQHVSEVFRPIASGGHWVAELANTVDCGRIGVVAFFCISGFVIPNSLRGTRLGGTKRFLVNRFFRLYPIYWLSIPLGVFSIWHLYGKQIDTASLLGNLSMAMTLQGTTPVQGHYWTLEVELIFYGLCAALFCAFQRLKFPSLAGAFVVCYLLQRNHVMDGTAGSLPFLFYHLSIMLAFSCLRSTHDLPKDTDKWTRLVQIAGTCVVLYATINISLELLVKGFNYDHQEWKKFGYGNTVGILLFLVALYLPQPFRWLAKIGRTTYSAYLLHAIVFYSILKLWTTYELPHLRAELYVAGIATITFAIAALSFRYIETPVVKFAKRLNKTSR